MAQTEDRRVRRTKRLLRQALAELMQEKEFKDITVTDLVERADINRGTFYVHYKDVYDLREQIENEMIETCRTLILDSTGALQTNSIRHVLQQAMIYLEENREMVCGLLRSGGEDNFAAKLIAVLEEQHVIRWANHSTYNRYISRFVGAGAVAIIQKWFLSEDTLPPEQMVDLIDQLLCRILPTLERENEKKY